MYMTVAIQTLEPLVVQVKPCQFLYEQASCPPAANKEAQQNTICKLVRLWQSLWLRRLVLVGETFILLEKVWHNINKYNPLVLE